MPIEVGDHIQFKPLKETIQIWRNHFPKAEEINVAEFTEEVKSLMNGDLVVSKIRDACVSNSKHSFQEVCFDFNTQYAMPLDCFTSFHVEESDDIPSLFGTMQYGS